MFLRMIIKMFRISLYFKIIFQNLYSFILIKTLFNKNILNILSKIQFNI